MDFLSDKILVMDTSSISRIKDEIFGLENQETVLNQFTKWCNENGVAYPSEVVDELKRFKGHNHLIAWADKNKDKAFRYGPCYEELNIVVNHPVAKFTFDASKKGEADPHILALALKIHSVEEVMPVVITNESNKYIPNVSLNVAANILGFQSINLYALLLITDVWNERFRRK